MRRIFFVAGENSGDAHAAEVIRELHRLNPEVEIHAYGGPRMAEAGATIHYDLTQLASIGLDWIKKIFTYYRLGLRIPDLCSELGIKTLVLVDFPGFNLRVATLARKAGIRVIYYITPQVWAWRTGRVKRMRRDIQQALVIFPFEEAFLRGHGLPVKFVGHPLVDRLKEIRPATLIHKETGLPEQPLLGLLPGSRPREVERLAPILLKTALLLLQQKPELHFVVPRADGIPIEVLDQIFAARIPWTLVNDPPPDLRSVFRACITKSGTSTLENALLGVPQVIIYKVSRFDAWIASQVMKVHWIGLVNLLAGREICPELLQDNCTPDLIAKKILPLLDDTPEREQMLQELRQVAMSLGAGQSAQKTAEAILENLL